MANTVIYGIYQSSNNGIGVFYRAEPESVIDASGPITLISNDATQTPIFATPANSPSPPGSISEWCDTKSEYEAILSKSPGRWPSENQPSQVSSVFTIKLMGSSPTRTEPLIPGGVYAITIYGQSIKGQVPPLTEAPGRVVISPVDGVWPPTYLGSNSKSAPSTPKTKSLMDSSNKHPSNKTTPKTMTYDPAAPVAQPAIFPIDLPIEDARFYDPMNYFRLGYVTLLIPPKSITITTENGVVAVDILRSQGDLNSVDYNTIQRVQIEFSSIGERQYNEVVIPILQQYNRMPFLPVTNVFLNSSWNIDALAIRDVVISSLEGIPGGIAVSIDAEPFDWKSYLPMNSSYQESFCWPLFKVWCEDVVKGRRCPTPLSSKDSGLNSNLVFSIPRKQALIDKSQLPTQNVPTTPVPGRGPSKSVLSQNLSSGSYKVQLGPGGNQTVLDRDSSVVLKALQNLRSGVYKWERVDKSPVVTLMANGQPFALLQFQSDRNVLHALTSADIQVYESAALRSGYKSATSLTINDITLSNQLSDKEKMAKAEALRVAAKNQTYGASKSEYSNLWFLIPMNSAVWTYVWQALNSSTSKTINDIVDMDYYALSPMSTVSSVTVQFASHLSTLQVEDAPLPRHQYLGGGDGFVSIQGILAGERDLELLRAMLDEVRELGRYYRTMEWDIPYPGFFGIKNSLINSLGLLHFIPINFSVSTVDGFPHLYSYQLDIMEYSPTQMRREEFDVMDKLITNWSLSLATGIPQDKLAQVMAENADKPEYLEKVLGNFYRPLTQADPLMQDIHEGSAMKEWRMSLLDARLRMVEMYPDMCLPSKVKLDHWITILRDWAHTGKDPDDPEDRKLLKSMRSVMSVNKHTLENIMMMAPSNDPMGYAEPDFFCVPAVQPTTWASELVDANFGVEVPTEELNRPSAKANSPKGYAHMLLTDSFGIQAIHKAGSHISSSTPTEDSGEAYAQQQLDLSSAYQTILAGKQSSERYSSSHYGNTPVDTEYAERYWGQTLDGLSLLQMEAGRDAPVWNGYPVLGVQTDPSYATSNYNEVIKDHPALASRVNEFLNRKSTPQIYNAVDLDNKIVTPLLHLIKTNPTQWGISQDVANHLDPGLILGVILAESDGGVRSGSGGGGSHKGLMSVSFSQDAPAIARELNQYTGKGPGEPPLGMDSSGPPPDNAYDALRNNNYDPVANVLAGILLIAGKMAAFSNDPWTMQANGVQGYRGINFGAGEMGGAGYTPGVMAFASLWNNVYSKSSPINNPSRTSPSGKKIYEEVISNAGIPKPEAARYLQMLESGQIGLDSIYRYHLCQMETRLFATPKGEKKTSPWNVVLEKYFPGTKKWEPLQGEARLAILPCLPTNIPIYPDNETTTPKSNLVDSSNMHNGYPYPTEPENGNKEWYGYTVYTDITPAAFPDPSKAANIYDYLYSKKPGALNPPAPSTLPMKFRPMFHDFQKKEYIGRLVGAFPSYLVQLVDGGMWVGIERLSDHFYGMSSVISISIVQTRKDPVDVATLAFSNLYNRLNSMAAMIELQKMQDTRTTDTFESWINGIKQFFTSQVTPDLEARREQWAKMLALRPGVRIHIRVGYGSDASQYPVRFNGTVSEVPTASDICEVVALGDGAELVKEASRNDGHWISDPIDSHQVWQNTGLFNFHGIEPRNIIGQLFSPTSSIIETLTHARWMTDNPYGIVDFGNLDFRAYGSYSLGECGVNLYESTQDPNNKSYAAENWYTINGSIAALHGQTLIGIEMESASPWGIAETCRMAVSDFILAVRPFEYRSTLFYGRDWFPYYYKYKYMTENPFQYNVSAPNPQTGSTAAKDYYVDGVDVLQDTDPDYTTLMESKAFSQFHVISSGYNLISSDITASSDNVLTECQSKYIYGGAWGSAMVYADVMHVDDDIYPQVRKGEVIQSGLLSGPGYGWEGLQRAFTWFTPINVVCHAANMYSAMTLRDAVADMYQGYSMIAGDPYMWPWDYVYFMDRGKLMNGMFQVKEVITQLSLETGYITLVSPDCLVSVASGMDTGVWMSLARFGMTVVSARLYLIAIGTILKAFSRWGLESRIVRWITGRPQAIKEAVAGKAQKAFETIAGDPEATPSETGVKPVDDLLNARKTIRDMGQGIKDAINKGADSPTGSKILGLIKKGWEGLSDAAKGIIKSVYRDIERYGLGSEEPRRATTPEGAQANANASTDTNTATSPDTGGGGEAAAPDETILPTEGETAVTQGETAVTEGETAVTQGETAVTEGEKAVTEGIDVGTQVGSDVAEGATGVGIIPLLVQLGALVITSSLGDMIGRYLAAKKCLVIMPLQVNGFEFSAGIEGHLGSVVGDPISLGDAWWASIFSTSYGREEHGIIGEIIPWVMNFVFPGATMQNPLHTNFSSSEDFIKNKLTKPNTDAWNSYMTSLNNRLAASSQGMSNPQSNYDYLFDGGNTSNTSTPSSPAVNNPNMDYSSNKTSSIYRLPVTPGTHPDLADLNPTFATNLSRFIEDMRKQNIIITVTSGYRGWAEQNAIYLSHHENEKVAARPGYSGHGFGMAADLNVSPSSAWSYVHSEARKYNLWFPIASTDKVHIELIPTIAQGFASSVLKTQPNQIGWDTWLATRESQFGR